MERDLKTVKQILMDRDGMTEEDADNLISDARRDFNDRMDAGEMPWDFCEEWFGLEPDYLDEFMMA